MTTSRKLMTADDLLAMPHDGMRYELICGQLIEMPPPGIMHGLVAANIGLLIGYFVKQRNSGYSLAAETGIHIERGPDTIRAADYAFVTRQRMTEPPPAQGYAFGVCPDLVVEVASPNDRQPEIDAKTQMWLGAGVRLVLNVYPETREVYAHHEDGSVQQFGIDDVLTCEPALPGFACPVADIFTY